MVNQYNVLIDFVGTILIGVIFLTGHRMPPHEDTFSRKLLHCLLFCCALVFVTDIPGLVLDGRCFPGATSLLWLFDTAYWVFQIIYCWLWLLFADYRVFASRERLRRYAIFFMLPMLLELLLIVTTPITGWVFSIGEANVYMRGSKYLWNMLPYIVYIAAAIFVSIYGARKNETPVRRRRCASLLVYMFLPVCGVFLDAIVYGISWLWPMVALSLLMVYLNVQQQAISDEQLAAAKAKTELTESRMAVMLSQIQPHFLYNALNSIQCLCRDDPQAAEQATAEFSQFLRGNMESLTMDKPIGFERELAHTKHYLALELLRFPDQLKVEYDLQTKLFRMPTLTLQPIVENAVRYGVTKKLEGGMVTISTRQTDDAFVVTVSDTGAGFDPMEPKDDGRTHIGIQNVRDRLTRMCGGRLEITSTPGVGTVAVITIPKERTI